jgi:hypothetical protein
MLQAKEGLRDLAITRSVGLARSSPLVEGAKNAPRFGQLANCHRQVGREPPRAIQRPAHDDIALESPRRAHRRIAPAHLLCAGAVVWSPPNTPSTTT